MSPGRRREIAGKGGRAAHARGTAHRWTSEEARSAGVQGARRSDRVRRLRAVREMLAAFNDDPFRES
jgi:hypothetical protein